MNRREAITEKNLQFCNKQMILYYIIYVNIIPNLIVVSQLTDFL